MWISLDGEPLLGQGMIFSFFCYINDFENVVVEKWHILYIVLIITATTFASIQVQAMHMMAQKASSHFCHFIRRQ